MDQIFKSLNCSSLYILKIYYNAYKYILNILVSDNLNSDFSYRDSVY